MANTNCLEGMACPECGHDEALLITVTITGEATVTDDGFDYSDLNNPQSYWDQYHWCRCPDCGFEGEVEDFVVDGARDA